jgi:hypothetical protein
MYAVDLKDWLRERGCQVILGANAIDPLNRGSIDYQRAEIKIGRQPPRGVLLTLGHEAGHWVTYLRYRNRANAPDFFLQKDREIAAYLFGWYALRQVKADRVITKSDWRQKFDQALQIIQAMDSASQLPFVKPQPADPSGDDLMDQLKKTPYRGRIIHNPHKRNVPLEELLSEKNNTGKN